MRRKPESGSNAVILKELVVLAGWCTCNALHPVLINL